MNAKRIRLVPLLLVAILAVLAACAPAAPPPTPASGTAPAAATATAKPAVSQTAAPPKATVNPTPAPPKALEKVKLQTTTKAAIYLAYYLGKEKGVFKDEGIDLEIVELQATLALPALLKGDVDYVALISRSFNGALTGMPVKLLMAVGNAPACYMIGGKGIMTAKDLVGKSAAVNSLGAGCHWGISQAVKKQGVDPEKDVKWLAIAASQDQYAALKNQQVAAAGLVTPYELIAIDEGFKEIVRPEDYPDIASNGIGTAETKIKDNPGQALRMVRAVLKSMLYMKQHRDEAVEILTREFKMEKKLAEAAYDQVATRGTSYNGTVSDGAVENLLTLAKLSGEVKQDVTPQKAREQVLELSILEKATKELGISR